jgi:hypothetical protein
LVCYYQEEENLQWENWSRLFCNKLNKTFNGWNKNTYHFSEKPGELLVLGFLQAIDRFYWPWSSDHRLISKTVIKSGRKLTIDVNFYVNVTKWDRGCCFCCFLYLKFFWDILMESSEQRFDYLLTEHHQYTWKLE